MAATSRPAEHRTRRPRRAADAEPPGVTVSRPDKVLYPAVGFTKAQVVDYYAAVARFIIPHLEDRPVALHRYPDGVNGPSFWEKDAPRYRPSWIKTFPVPRRHSGEPPIQYVLINDRRTLAWAANLANLELHPFLHRVPAIDRPTAIVFDLDPGEGADILTCARVAVVLKAVLDRLRLRSFPKVSGSKGLQLYVPLHTAVTYEATQPFARAIAALLERQHPQLIVADMAKRVRAGKVLIDWSQNAIHKTTVGVYSLRAKRERPFVSLPVTWRELEKALANEDAAGLSYEPDAALKRLARVGDIFAPVLTLRQELPSEIASVLRSGPPVPVRAPKTPRRRGTPLRS